MKTRKQVVFEEATRLFREKGYMASTMRELAERVGLKQASSLYNHYNNKEEILQQICFENAHQFINGIKTIDTTETQAIDKIKALIALHIRIATEDISSVTVFNDEWRHLTEPHLTTFLSLRKDYEERFKKIIIEGIESTQFKPLDPTFILYTLLNSIKWIHYGSNKKMDKKLLEANLTSLLLNGLEI